jgi:hypothetical protein
MEHVNLSPSLLINVCIKLSCADANSIMTPDELLKLRRETRVKQFLQYREEDRHECNLMVIRVTAAVISQTFLATAVGWFYKNSARSDDTTYLYVLVVIGILLAIISSFAIVIGGGVLRAWHKHGMALIAEDNGDAEWWDPERTKKNSPNPNPDNFLRGFYLNRPQSDWRHKWTMDRFLPAPPILFGTGWIVFICLEVTNPCIQRILALGLAIVWFTWIMKLIDVGKRAGTGLELPGSEYELPGPSTKTH